MKQHLDKTLQLFLQSLGDLKNKKIAIGYSAGADSTALLYLLAKKKDYFQFNLEAVFFTHSNSPINDGEDKNLQLAKQTCLKLNIPLITTEIEMNKSSKKSWEQIGREGRLGFYEKSNYDFVFLGHHLDDQNENTMIQLFRGGGKGVSGMKEIESIYCRPLLKTPKNEIYQFLTSQKIQWIEDPTNKNTYFTRNFWRQEILPKIEEHYPNYSQTLSKFREKQTSLHKLSYDLAVIDGLNEFNENKPVKIKHLDDYRIENLISQSFKNDGKSIENNKISNLLKIWRATGFSEIQTEEKNITLKNDEALLTCLTLNNTTKIKKTI